MISNCSNAETLNDEETFDVIRRESSEEMEILAAGIPPPTENRLKKKKKKKRSTTNSPRPFAYSLHPLDSVVERETRELDQLDSDCESTEVEQKDSMEKMFR